MKKRKVVYNLINILVLLAAALIFVFNYINTDIFAVLKWEQLAVITIAVVIVHFLKAFRLYLALYGSGLSIYSYSKIYCKVTPISILFPFKLGELFRMYCYGYQTDNIFYILLIFSYYLIKIHLFYHYQTVRIHRKTIVFCA